MIKEARLRTASEPRAHASTRAMTPRPRPCYVRQGIMSGMVKGAETTELRRGVLGPCVLALLAERPRFGLELVRDLSRADGLLTSEGTVYPLLNRLREAGLVTSQWHAEEGDRARRYYSLTSAGQQNLTDFRFAWPRFAATVGRVLYQDE